MPNAAQPDVSARGHGARSSGDLLLLRQSHIFAAVVRELLAVKPVREVSRAPLTLSQFHVLKVMSLNGQHKVGQVADFLGVSAPAASKTLDKLERLGLVVRSRSEGDRRATLLSVSPRGRRLVRRYEALKRERLAPVLEAFDDEELAQLAGLLQRFSLALLQKELAGGDDNGVCLRCDAYIEKGCVVGRLRGGCPYEGSSCVHVPPPAARSLAGPFQKPRGQA